MKISGFAYFHYLSKIGRLVIKPARYLSKYDQSRSGDS